MENDFILHLFPLSSPIGTTARPDSFVNKQNLQWAMNEVWTLRVKVSPASTPNTTLPPAVSSVSPLPSSPITSYPFELPERRSTLRTLIDEFRRGENQYDSVNNGGNPSGDPSGKWSSSAMSLPATVRNCATSWSEAAMARRQLLKAPPQRRRDIPSTSGGTMKKSASVWYATPPSPDRQLVSRMSMPNLIAGPPKECPFQPFNIAERIPEEI